MLVAAHVFFFEEKEGVRRLDLLLLLVLESLASCKFVSGIHAASLKVAKE
jgi:hypothetical protein